MAMDLLQQFKPLIDGTEQGFKPYLKINGSGVRLEKTEKNKVLGFKSVVKLNAGKNNFEFIQRRGAPRPMKPIFLIAIRGLPCCGHLECSLGDGH